MADQDVWGLGNIGVLEGAYRVPIATGPNAGGHTPLSNFIAKIGASFYVDGSAPLLVEQSGGVTVVNNRPSNANDAIINWTVNGASNFWIGQVSWEGGGQGWGLFNNHIASWGLYFKSDGTKFTGPGLVGLNYNSPQTALDIASGDQGTCRVRLRNTAGDGHVWDLVNGLHNASQQGFSLFNATNTFTPFYITNGGLVGIGQMAGTNPAYNLTLRGTSGITFGIANSGDAERGATISVTGTGGSGSLNIGTTSSGYQINFAIDGSGAWIIDANKNLLPATDNAKILGWSALRIQNIYLANNPIVTSDEREKEWRSAATSAELDAAERIIAELGFFQWKSSIDEKGARDARFHFGVRAQRVWQIMAEAELIEPLKKGKPGRTPYAFLCYDEWVDIVEPEFKDKRIKKVRTVEKAGKIINPNTGEPAVLEVDETYYEVESVATGKNKIVVDAGDRFGVRLDQLHGFLIAAQQRIIERDRAARDELEKRLEKLEAAIAKGG